VAGLLARHGICATEQGFSSGSGSAEAIRGAISCPGPDTILVVRGVGGSGEQVLVRSEAALALLAELPRPWPLVGVAFGWIPRWVRDLGYRMIARWRYRIWGRLESCPLPTALERARFL